MKKGFLNRPGALNVDQKLPPAKTSGKQVTVPTTSPLTACKAKTIVHIPTGAIFPDPVDPNPLSTWKNFTAIHIVALPRSLPPGEDQATCMLLPGVKDKILAIPSFPGPGLPLPVPARYRIDACPGAGLGMFSTMDLKPSDLVLVERPLLVMPTVIPQHSTFLYEDARQGMFDTMVSAMPAADRKAFQALSNCKGEKSAFKGIADTNSVHIRTLPGHNISHAAVCRDISRINHSCSPNAVIHWDISTFSFSLRALRPISAGEQITIQYCDCLQPRADRRTELLSKYTFTCSCISCSLPEPASAASDERRLYLKSDPIGPPDESHLKAWLRDESLPDDYIIKKCEKTWEMLEAEDGCGYPEDLWPLLVQCACKAYCAIGNLEGARKWAERGTFLSKAFLGTYAGWQNVFEAPQNTAWWELRVKLKAKTSSSVNDGEVVKRC